MRRGTCINTLVSQASPHTPHTSPLPITIETVAQSLSNVALGNTITHKAVSS